MKNLFIRFPCNFKAGCRWLVLQSYLRNIRQKFWSRKYGNCTLQRRDECPERPLGSPGTGSNGTGDGGGRDNRQGRRREPSGRKEADKTQYLPYSIFAFHCGFILSMALRQLDGPNDNVCDSIPTAGPGACTCRWCHQSSWHSVRRSPSKAFGRSTAQAMFRFESVG